MWPNLSLNADVPHAQLPSMHEVREQVEGGGLMSYGPNIPDNFLFDEDSETC